MISTSALVIPAGIHAALRAHLFPGDGKEAAAILPCAASPGRRIKFLAREVIPVPHDACLVREPDRITWPGIWIEAAIDRSEKEGLHLVLIHSHPGGLFEFSAADDASDRVVVPGLFAAYDAHHGTAIMTPDGAIKARFYDHEFRPTAIDMGMVPGDDIRIWWSDRRYDTPMAFTSEMTAANGRLSVAVVGASGTGSIVIEQLARLGFGRIVAIDFDKVEFKNLNRILNTGRLDVGRHKVEVMAEAAASHRGSDTVVPVPQSIATREAVLAASDCDFLVCCVDTLEARHVADLMSAMFLMPLIDMGVVVPVRGQGKNARIADVYGRIEYVYPGGATLEDRGVYDPERLRQEYLRTHAPDAHEAEMRDGYIKGIVEEAPSVITLNMRAASTAVSELLARLYPFRHDANRRYARTTFSLAACEEEYVPEEAFSVSGAIPLARGGDEPLLGLPILSAPRSAS